MTRLTRDDLLENVRRLFVPAAGMTGRNSRSIGAELEMIPVTLSGARRVLAQEGTPNGSSFVNSMANEFGWTEERMTPDPSCWNFADGRVSFEPGGQIEFSSAVFPTASELVRALEKWTGIFSDRAAGLGIALRTIGIDERTPIAEVPLQLQRDRYTAMNAYFNSLGPFGVLMMRQTASLQVNVERGPNPIGRWHLLNALTPYIVAIFANSPALDETGTRHKSYRAHVWRMLDPRRTGIPAQDDDPVNSYLEFALDAPVIFHERGGSYPTFRTLLHEGGVTPESWELHLTTLFPEIRPREYFEIRSMDAIDPSHIVAAIAFVTGIVYAAHPATVIEVLGMPDELLLPRAGVRGLDDPAIREKAVHLFRLALEGCYALGEDYISKSDVTKAEEFFSLYTIHGRCPADDRS